MPQPALNAYLESRITAAQPMELVHLLYHAATGAVREARAHLAAGDIAGRAAKISKAFAILTELTRSLDGERGGAVAAGLHQLYDYLQRRLLEANFQQADEPLAEVLGLLAGLAEAWDGAVANNRPPEPARPQPSSAWSQPDPDVVAGHAWSF